MASTISKAKVKYRRSLNAQQIDVLQWLFSFRFSTAKQIAQQLGKADKTAQKKLQILEQQGYIGKRYDKHYKLAGRPAEYYLTPKGAKQLETAKPDSTNPNAIKTLYRNKTVSEDFIDHCLTVCNTALKLQALYRKKIRLLTKSQVQKIEYFPAWSPDLFVRLQMSQDKDDRQSYFLDAWDGTKPFFVTVRKARNYLAYAEQGDWPTDQTAFPSILMICENDRIQKKLNRQIRRALEDTYEDEIVFATTTQQAFNESKTTDRIWYKVQTDNLDDENDMQPLEQVV